MIEIKGLQKVVGQGTALDLASLIVEPGQIAAVVGPAGSGKEVLWELLIGKVRPSAGSVRLAGVDPAEGKGGFSREVGVLFAEDALYKHQSPLANLALHCRLYGLPIARAHEVLAQVGLADQANANLDKLPSGLLRRLAIGRAILHKPAVLLLYEPFARCDATTIALLGNLIHELAVGGTAILILADDAAHLGELGAALYRLEQGRLSAERVLTDAQPSAMPFKIPVRLEDKVRLLNPTEILYAEAEGGRAVVRTGDARFVTQFSLGELEERLARSGFFRAHRAYLVNLQHIKEVIPYTRNSFSLRLDDAAGTEIPLSKSAAAELRELLGY
jgi:ABC-2 type transport system ATP-binding protein